MKCLRYDATSQYSRLPFQEMSNNSLNAMLRTHSSTSPYTLSHPPPPSMAWFEFRFLFSLFVYFFSELNIFNKLNWLNHTSPLKSINSITCSMKRNRLNKQLSRLEKEFNQFDQFLLKKMNRFARNDSIELIGVQVWLEVSKKREPDIDQICK